MPPPRHTVTLYTKPGCHLCEAVEQVIRRVAARREFDFVARNIESDPTDYEMYRNDIPVVTVDGVEIARHRMTAAQLERALGISR
jgi:glutaredoxin